MPRVGEILLQHGWVDATSVQRAVAEQRQAGKRLCSLLIARGLLDPDHASRALGEQHGVAAVLQKHLENREADLGKLLPAPLARAWYALPIGRLRNGELIVCVRDPRPELHAALAQTVGASVVMAVAPAHQLERLIEQTYEAPAAGDEWDVDMTTGPIVSVDVELESGPARRPQARQSTLSEVERLTLVDLDDSRVARDPTQSGAMQAAGARPPITLPPSVRAAGASAAATRSQERPVAKAPAVVPLPATIAALSGATTRDAATEIAMRFAAGRWSSALLLTIKEGAALGHRGYGPLLEGDAVHAVALPLSAPSIVKAAFETRRVAGEPPVGAGAIRDRLHRLLGAPRHPAAAPVMVGPHVACVFVVGDPTDRDVQHVSDLEELVAGLGAAYLRVVREKKG